MFTVTVSTIQTAAINAKVKVNKNSVLLLQIKIIAGGKYFFEINNFN